MKAKRLSREAQLHADWLGMLQPEGLVVSVPVLEEAGAYVQQPLEVQRRLRALCPEGVLADPGAMLRLLRDVLGWPEATLLREGEVLDRLTFDHPDLGATLRPDAVLVDPSGAPLVAVRWSPGDMDRPAADHRWPASPEERFERLLTESQPEPGQGLAVGVHCDPDTVRLVYAPRGEAPGTLSFPVEAMVAADGRILVDALVMLLGRARLLTSPSDQRLVPLLRRSRQRQDEVTEALAGQVQEALQILLRGFDTAHDRSGGALFRGLDDGDDDGEGRAALQAGLTTVLLRLVFLLYAEDRALMPVESELYQNHYSVAGLADRLQRDRLLQPQAMDRRFGAWSRLLALFRLVFEGARHGDLFLPPRQGDLFHPGRFPFLEGRPPGSTDWRNDPGRVPPLDDDTVGAVLDRLVTLDGQRISYRNLDVEQIGSVYEALMGFSLRRARGQAVVLRPGDRVLELWEALEGDDPVRAVAAVAGLKPAEVARRAPDLASFTPTGDDGADTEALLRALRPLLADRPPLRAGQHYLQPGDDRRRSGSHYTPRTLTEPIVERTLGPVLDRDGPPTPEAVLAMRICDPAMGSGAFLAAACRYLARRLVEAWARTDTLPPEARHRDPLVHAQRLVAERCLYGVDKNPFAVQLARLSLWLVTLDRNLPFTFVDHALREGDAVVGLDVNQIGAFAFHGEQQKGQLSLFAWRMIRKAMQSAARIRERLHGPEAPTFTTKKMLADDAADDVAKERAMGDLLIACAWAGGTAKELRQRLQRVGDRVRDWYFADGGVLELDGECRELRDALPMRPFHWPLEFPEVFDRKEPGFDAVVGNPPFAGKNTILAANGDRYIEVLKALHPHAHGNSDLVAHFFLRARGILRPGGCFGLVATNTINQGDTRATGLQHLVENGVALYDVRPDEPWPVAGAAVVVTTVGGCVGPWAGVKRIGGAVVRDINSALTDGGEDADPVRLEANADRSFVGSYVLGMGFVLTPEAAEALGAADVRNREIIKPYIGGEELNSSPTLSHQRYVIDFGDRTLGEAEEWPELIEIVRRKVKPERDALKDNPDGRRRKQQWWQFGRRTPALEAALSQLPRCLANSQVSKHILFAFQPTDRVFAHTLNVFPFDDPYHFALLQSRVHEPWALTMGSSLETRPRYTPSRCFETFPFPRPAEAQRVAVAAAGEALYEARSRLMLKNREGMTRIWNRLRDPDERDPDVLELRRLRDAMDRAVLEAYGWTDLAPDDREAIVARLRKLNAARAAEEAAGAAM
ncbi:N-6 DNA methylase [Myxococcota bacterium]|nr:N-6 DNA methylase [Myxococcota bacterium]